MMMLIVVLIVNHLLKMVILFGVVRQLDAMMVGQNMSVQAVIGDLQEVK